MYLDKSVSFVKARKIKEIELPEPFNCTVIVREFSVKQLAEVKDKTREEQLAMSIVGPDGCQIFTTEDDLINLAEMPRAISGALFSAVNEVNGFSDEAKEETVKN